MSWLLAEFSPEEEAKIEAYLREKEQLRESGAMHEEIPWTDEDEADTRAIMDVLGTRWARQERQARRERMRAHAINPEVERGGNGAGA